MRITSLGLRVITSKNTLPSHPRHSVVSSPSSSLSPPLFSLSFLPFLFSVSPPLSPLSLFPKFPPSLRNSPPPSSAFIDTPLRSFATYVLLTPCAPPPSKAFQYTTALLLLITLAACILHTLGLPNSPNPYVSFSSEQLTMKLTLLVLTIRFFKNSMPSSLLKFSLLSNISETYFMRICGSPRVPFSTCDPRPPRTFLHTYLMPPWKLQLTPTNNSGTIPPLRSSKPLGILAGPKTRSSTDWSSSSGRVR